MQFSLYSLVSGIQSPILSLTSFSLWGNPLYFSSIPGIHSYHQNPPQPDNLPLSFYPYSLPKASLTGSLNTCPPLKDKHNHSFKLEDTLQTMQWLPWHHRALSIAKPTSEPYIPSSWGHLDNFSMSIPGTAGAIGYPKRVFKIFMY